MESYVTIFGKKELSIVESEKGHFSQAPSVLERTNQ